MFMCLSVCYTYSSTTSNKASYQRFQRPWLDMTKKNEKGLFYKNALFRSYVAGYAFRLTAVSTGTGAAGFTSMTEFSKLVEKAIWRLNTTWNSVKQQAIAWCLS